MSTSTTIAPARPRLVRRAAVAMSLTAALAGGTLVAGAGTASAAPASTTTASASTAALGGVVVTGKKKATPNVKVSVSRKKGTKGKAHTRPKYTVKVTKHGDAVKSRVRLFINGDKKAVKKVNKNGIVRFRPGWGKYDTGKNRIRLTVVPAKSTGLAKEKKHRVVRAKAKQNRGQKVVRVAHKYVGHRYSYGGGSPRTGFDCSGFTSYVYKKATGKTLPRSSSAQRSAGKKVSRSKAKKGDIVYTPGHVAIYAGNGRIIEAARPGVGVVKRKMWQDNPTFIRV